MKSALETFREGMLYFGTRRAEQRPGPLAFKHGFFQE
jgi:hypothetical protein